MSEHWAWSVAPDAGRRVRLRPLTLDDMPWFHQVAVSDSSLPLWRLQGRGVDYQTFVEFIWSATDDSAVIVASATGEPLGIAQTYGHDRESAHASVAFLFTEASRNLGWPMEGCVLYLHHALVTSELRKVYIDAPAFTMSNFQSLVGRAMVVEAVLRRHDYFDGNYHDRSIGAIARDRWDAERMLQLCGHRPPPRDEPRTAPE